MNWKKFDLEVSLKPFSDLSDAGIRRVAQKIFSQWRNMIENADSVSLMFWAADGSEILEFNGNLNERFEWGKWIGVANPHYDPPSGLPLDEQCMHEHPRLYMENPPEITYGDFKRILTILRQEFKKLFGEKTFRLGATFDSGPEFAISDFKYVRHPEICRGNVLGTKTFVCCYTTLHADEHAYAGFPHGIPEGTTFGTFLGRQAQHYLSAMGFDYLWLSNGMGFGMETWGITGAVFDGMHFDAARCAEVKEAMFGFWNDFRRECPDYPLETRGTNLTTGLDLASDATPAREIYREVHDLEAPVNSPWAALNGDFGMELAGWMSHIAELPRGKTGYPFRYYIHDPWFVNSPWIDRYIRSPYDIYLPLSIARLGADGRITPPNALHLLSIDDSYGRMPDLVPLEVSAALYDGAMTMPDVPGPLLWVYPFDEYHDLVYAGERMEEVFANDYLIRSAINGGFPLNSVISGANFRRAYENGVTFPERVLVVSTIFAVTPAVLEAVRAHLAAGGKVIFYGPAHGKEVEALIGVRPAEALEGECSLSGTEEFCNITRVKHLSTYSGGPLDRIAVPADPTVRVLAAYHFGQESRPAALVREMPEWNGGKLLWIRGTNSMSFRPNAPYPDWFSESEYCHCEKFFRYFLPEVGYEINFHKASFFSPDSCMTLRYHANALYLVGYAKDTTGDVSLRFPDGAPVFCRSDARIRNNRAFYHLERSTNYEGRIFVNGDDSIVCCRDMPLAYAGVHRVIELSGLKNAEVVFRPEETEGMSFNFTNCERSLWSPADYAFERTRDAVGEKFIIHNVTGVLRIAWGVRHEYC